MSKESYESKHYEEKYSAGYGTLYPEGQIIRAHKQVLEWELNFPAGKILDFGCGTGANLKYFVDQGYEPYGCDTSATAIGRCKKSLPAYQSNFVTSLAEPNLERDFPGLGFDLFLSNQVLYYLDDVSIAKLAQQAHAKLRKGGVFIASMMANSCWFADNVVGKEGDFSKVELSTARLKQTTLINFKDRDELLDLFSPFRKLHLGIYGANVREDEGRADHHLFIGIKD